VIWDQNYGDLSSSLKTVVLDVDFLRLNYEILNERRPPRFQMEEKIYGIADGRKVRFHSG